MMPTISPDNTSLTYTSKQITTNLGKEFDEEINQPEDFLNSLLSKTPVIKYCHKNKASKAFIKLNVPNVNIQFNDQLIVIQGEESGGQSEGVYLYDKNELLHHFKRAVLKKHTLDISYEPRRFETSVFFDTALKEIEGNIFTSSAFNDLEIRFTLLEETNHQAQINPSSTSTSLNQLDTGFIEECKIQNYPKDLSDPLFHYLNLVLELRDLRNSLIRYERENVYRPYIIKSMSILMILIPFGLVYGNHDLAHYFIFILTAVIAIWCSYMVHSYTHHYSIPQTASNRYKAFFETIHNPKDIEQREVTPDGDDSEIEFSFA